MKPHFKIYFSLFLCILLGASVFAQEEDGATPPEGYFSTIENQEPENICPAPHVEFRSLVMYERSSTVLLKVNSLDRTMTSLYLVAKGKDETRRDVEDGFVEIQGLKNNLTYDVMAYNECGEMATVGQVNTFFKEGVIEVSQELFGKIAQWGKDENKPRMMDYLDQISEIHFLERLSYAQQFYLNSKPISESEKSDIFLSNASIAKLMALTVGYKDMSDGCNCHWTTYAISAKPFNDNYSPDFYPTSGTEINFQNNSYLKNHSYKRVGPAHTETAQIEGWCATGYYYDYQPQGIINNAKMGYMMTCEPYPGYRGTCNCKYELKVSYGYQAKLGAKTEIVSTWQTAFCGSKSSAAAAEEIAVMTMTDWNGNVTPLAAGQASVRGSCNRSFNTDFLVNLVSSFGAGAAIALAVAGDSMPTADQISTLVTSIQTLIQTPVNTNVTACSDQIVPANLLEGSKVIALDANKAIALSLGSYTHLYAGGVTAWKSKASSASNYYMAASYGTHSNNISFGSACCTERYGRWIGSSASGAPLFGGSALQDAAFFFSLNGPWNSQYVDPFSGLPILPRIPLINGNLTHPLDLLMYTSVGSIYGPQPSDCYVSSAGRLSPPDELSTDGNSVYLNLPNDGRYDQYTLFDNSGKIIKQGAVSDDKFILNYGTDNAVPSGSYHIYVYGKDKFTTTTFIKI